MQKIIFFLLFFTSISSTCFAKLTNNDKAKYPYALLTNDYDILNVNDLALNSCFVETVIFSPKSHTYPYWQCFPISQISFLCDPAGKDDDNKTETALLLINVTTAKEKYNYVPRRAMAMSNCLWFKKRWNKSIRNEKYACLSGSFAGYEKEGNKEIPIWVFDKFKTKKSCESYFDGGCSLKYAKKNGCKI